MRQWITVLFLMACADFSQAQDARFTQTVHFIQSKIHCCSVPFSPSVKRKVDSVSVAINGDVTLHYSGNKPPQTFNLLKLYKEKGNATGMDTIMKGRYIQFHVNPDKINLIRLATAVDAREVYTAFLELRDLCKRDNQGSEQQ